MKNLRKEDVVDLALNMVRVVNAQITQDILDLEPEELSPSFKTKNYEVTLIIKAKANINDLFEVEIK